MNLRGRLACHAGPFTQGFIRLITERQFEPADERFESKDGKSPFR